ncbi:MAG: site-specific integrase [Acidobacteriota bacterium]|nr:site-specific integrase [Acidobacteriota bacterium]
MPEKAPRQRGQVKDLGGGKYKIAVPLGTRPDGSRPYHHETLRGTTEPKAWKRVVAVLAQVDSGTYFLASREPIKDVIEERLDRLRRDGRKRLTLERYRMHAETHILPALGAETPVGEVTADSIQAMVNRMQDEGYNPRYVGDVYRGLKAALARAVRKGKLARNPADDVDLPPAGRPKKARVFDEREALDFIETCRREPRDFLFVFSLLTGLRPSEFMGLEYPNLSLAVEGDRERGLAVVEKIIVRPRNGGWEFGTPKTPTSARRVYFPAGMYYDLMAAKGEHLERLRRLGQSHQLVFTGFCGRPLHPGSLLRRFLKVCEAAGVGTAGRSLYTLRRSHATISLLAGENLKSLSERMGHASVEFTQNEYVDALPVMHQMAADRLENRLLRTNLAHEGAGHVM